MASIAIQAPAATGWRYRGSDVAYYETVPGANCRPEKQVVTQIVGPVQSACESFDTCPPFVANYHKWGASLSIFDFVAGLGIGCLLMSGSLKFTRRDENTTNGNNVTGPTAISNLTTMASAFATGGAWITTDFFGANATTARVCPTP